MNLNIEHPFYEVEIKTRGCVVELLINDIPSFSNYKEGDMAVDWPINECISKSGVQLFNIKVKKYPDEEVFNKKAKIFFKVFVRDAYKSTVLNDFQKEVPRILLFELPLINFEDKEVQKYTYASHFRAMVPYELNSWENSVSLLNDEKDSLLSELYTWYNKFYNIFKNTDETEYHKITADRFNDLAEVFYLDTKSKNEVASRMFSSIHSSIEKVPFIGCELNVFGNGKLVGLKFPNEPYGFKYKSSVEGKPNFVELLLFHRKEKGAGLSIIR